MKSLILILAMFRAEAAEAGVILPDSITIEYAVLGTDTLGVATKAGNVWAVKISLLVEPDLIETVVYHELGHVCGLDHCKGRSIMNYGYMVPLTPAIKKRFLSQIVQFQKLCNEQKQARR
jgi:predicted Zn-dependent protease